MDDLKKSMNKREFIRLGFTGFAGLCLLRHWPLSFLSTGQKPSKKLWKWHKEAMYYEKTISGKIRCRKCPNQCVLNDRQTGICRNRVSYEGKLYSIAYGNPCAVHVDPIEKKPFYHFLPTAKSYSIAVAGCNLSCLNCQNWQISQASPLETRNYDLMPEQVVQEAIRWGCETIAYTYSEPITFYEYVLDTAKIARQKKIRNLFKSNGYICEEPLRELAGILDAANIDLKTFDDEVYQKLNAGRLDPVLKTLLVLKEKKVWTEITNLIIPGWTDNLKTIETMCRWFVDHGLENCPLHFSRFSPLYKLNQVPSTPVTTMEKARETARRAGMRYVYIGNVPGHSAEQTYCHHCGKRIIDRRGYVIVQNDIVKGACRFCKTTIPGVWS